MGQAKIRVQTILQLSPICIFCGGAEPTTTVDHQPARSLFDEKQWPDGYAFPACEACNQASKDEEHKLALLVRFSANPIDNPVRAQEFDKYLVAMRNNFPNFVTPLSANAKRRFLKSEGLQRPPGAALADFHAAGIDPESAERLLDASIKKLLRALHWKHTGNIVRRPEGVKAQWYTNAYFHVLGENEKQFFEGLPARPPIIRNNRDLSDQFFYRYATDDTGENSAFAIVFRDSLIVTGIVAQSDEVLAEMRAIESERASESTSATVRRTGHL